MRERPFEAARMSQQINLFNPLFLRKEKYFSARTMLQALGLIALGIACLYAFAVFQTRGLARTAAEYARQANAQRDQLVELSGKGRSKLLEAEVARLEAEVKARRALVETLQGGELGDTEGFSRYFAAFGRRPMQGVWLTGFSVGDGGNELKIRGRVLFPDLVPAYLKSLNEEEVMRGRQVTDLKLVARDESLARRGATDAGPAAGPERYVEFDLSAPLQLAEAAKAPAKGGRP
jgi:hypothetical protein